MNWGNARRDGTPAYTPAPDFVAFSIPPARFPGAPCWPSGGLHMTMYPDRSKCSTNRVLSELGRSANETRTNLPANGKSNEKFSLGMEPFRTGTYLCALALFQASIRRGECPNQRSRSFLC
jgi:hypothetical protein